MISRRGRTHSDWNLKLTQKNVSLGIGLNHGLRAPKVGMGRCRIPEVKCFLGQLVE